MIQECFFTLSYCVDFMSFQCFKQARAMYIGILLTKLYPLIYFVYLPLLMSIEFFFKEDALLYISCKSNNFKMLAGNLCHIFSYRPYSYHIKSLNGINILKTSEYQIHFISPSFVTQWLLPFSNIFSSIALLCFTLLCPIW